ncbi:MAG: hypothetical protein MUF01_09715 [Bryobacterales bacterium]|jgi:hypothetical protein|nr:hypothetical protein [Bryobacterales bacterium]
MQHPINHHAQPALPRGEDVALDTPLTIGFSFLGKPLEVRHWGNPTAPLRVLFLCGQHGDERGIRRALGEFVQKQLAGLLAGMPHLQLAILADANPDGYELGVRQNAQGIDLNRDHLRLEAPETRAIHRFVGAWKPHLVVDMHNFPVRRKVLQQAELRLDWDVCLDYPSNPASGLSTGHPLLQSLMAALKLDLEANAFRFGRYCVFDSKNGVRHGTPHLVDARNVLTLRHGALTLLLEARNPSSQEDRAQRRHVRQAVARACEGILRWCQLHQTELATPAALLSTQARIPLRFRRPLSPEGFLAPVADLHSGEPSSLCFPRYRPQTQGRRHVESPFAYAVPVAAHDLLRVLARHGFQSYLAARGERCIVSESLYGGVGPQPPADAPRLPRMSSLRYERSLEGFVIFPFQQPGAKLLALMLEPESVYSLHRLFTRSNKMQLGSLCPVRRVLLPCSPLGCDFFFEVAS